MATLVSPPVSLSSGHAFASHHNEFVAFHQQHQLRQHRGPTAAQQHNPFEAFTSRHHSGAKSASAAASWRHSEPVDHAPIATRPTPRYRRGVPSHSRTPSTSSEASSSSWRDRSRSPAVATVDLQPAAQQPKPKVSTVPVYSFADLLGLSASPLVGISDESQAVVDDLVAHHVWRRGPQSGTPKAGRRRRNRGTSGQRSSSPSSPSSASSTADDSERID